MYPHFLEFNAKLELAYTFKQCYSDMKQILAYCLLQFPSDFLFMKPAGDKLVNCEVCLPLNIYCGFQYLNAAQVRHIPDSAFQKNM